MGKKFLTLLCILLMVSSQAFSQCSGTITTTNATCGNGGTATFIPGPSFTPPLNYNWGNGQTGSTATNLLAGSYFLLVTDSTGCVFQDTFTIAITNTLNLSVNVTDDLCDGNGGQIELVATGGNPPYFYYLNGVYSASPVFTGLATGNYSAWVEDSDSCFVASGGTVTSSLGLAEIVGDSIIFCNDTITLQVIHNGTNPTFLWSTGETSSSINILSGGTYSVTLTDGNCTSVASYYVWEEPCDVTITGQVNLDPVPDCVPDSSGFTPLSNQMLRLLPDNVYAITDYYGNYSFTRTTGGSYTIEWVTAAPYGILCPSSNSISVPGTVVGSTYSGNDFILEYVGTGPQDLTISLTAYSNASPGFQYWTRMDYCNSGNSVMSGTIDLVYDPSLTNFDPWTTSIPFVHNAAANTVTYTFSNLAPGQCGVAYADFIVPVGATLGNTVNSVAVINPTAGDAYPLDNVDNLASTIVGSWDPNDIQVTPFRTGNEFDGGIIFIDDNTLTYTIRFQNTGTAPAVNVVLKDLLEEDLDISTIRNFSSSHTYSSSIVNDRELNFTFPNIMLPTEASDVHGSIGFIKFDIDRVAGLPLGREIVNQADIYFDFNQPIITNEPVSTIGELSTTENPESTVSIKAGPNPFKTDLTLSYTLSNDAEVEVRVLDVLGKVVDIIATPTNTPAGQHQLIWTPDHLASGVYMIEIRSGNSVKTERVVKSK